MPQVNLEQPPAETLRQMAGGFSLPPADLQLAVSAAHPLYVLPGDSIAEEVLIPALRASAALDVMTGYFSSASLAEIGPGLATFLRNSAAPMRMIVSPFLTAEDFDVLTQDREALTRLAERILINDVPDEDALARHTLECLAWLITQNRLLIQVAVMRDALFHPKVWLFADGANRAALHGSTNLTQGGLSRNKEQLTLSRDWKGAEAVFHVERLRQEFDALWAGGDENCRVLRLPEAVERRLVRKYKTEALPGERSAASLGQSPPPDPVIGKAELHIPDWLIYESGDFAHQGQAVAAWEKSGRKGILEMATGSGKTITSMICAARLQDEVGKLLVVVSAPYRPLIEQWCGEIEEFGVRPINLAEAGGPGKREREIKQAGRRLRMGNSRAEALVVSNDTLRTPKFIADVAAAKAPKLLIADECHNLGAASFTADPPEIFDFRLGLSATPVRQYDEQGTDALIAYFGDICFSFTLEQAVGKCLTEYDYHVHFAELSRGEMDAWQELTEKISALSWKTEDGERDPYLDNLLRKRRLILETAQQKLDILASLLDDRGPRAFKHTLIYATDKQPEQLARVNALLQERRILFHQLTAEETSSREQTRKILAAFQEGGLRILTAKRVLDEGVNIPQIETAYVLASTTVRRQWIQRRGRLLRTCKEIGKTHAVIHDFVVLPPGTSSRTVETLDADARKLVRSELERVWEFARLSRNGPLNGGPYEAVRHLQNLANERVMN